MKKAIIQMFALITVVLIIGALNKWINHEWPTVIEWCVLGYLAQIQGKTLE